MKLLPLTYKTVLDEEGHPIALEVHQGNQHVTISLAVSMSSAKAHYRWDEVKETINNIAERVKVM